MGTTHSGYLWEISVLLSLYLLKEAADVAGQFTAAPATCPGETFTFRCTVSGDLNGVTIWRVGGSSECPLPHRSNSSSICGPNNVFKAKSSTGFGTSATTYSSTLSGTATPELNGTLVECFQQATSLAPQRIINSTTLMLLGPPSIPALSCVDLSGNVSGAVNVTVSWTLSKGGSADFYLINITTNAPQTLYEGILNANITQYKLIGLMADIGYNITVCGVNCGSQKGRESEPVIITPQVPAVPSHCNISLSYNQLSKKLLFINSTWSSVHDPIDPAKACPGPSGNVTHYQISFQTGPFVKNISVNDCEGGKCSHSFEPPSNPPLSYDRVSVAAENVVGVGAVKLCTARIISTTNNLLAGRIIDVNSPNNATISCTFLCGLHGSAHCTVQYGTDPTYMILPYSAESTETGTAGDSVSVILREQLNSSTVYYYTVSAVSGDLTVMVQGTFTTPQYSCSLSDLALTDTVGQCADRGFTNTLHISSGMVCYNRTTAGSEAVYSCDNGFRQDGAEKRVCQSDGEWNGSMPQCLQAPRHDGSADSFTNGAALGIAVATTAVVFFIAGVIGGTLATIVVYHCMKQSRSSKPISLQQTVPEYEEVIQLSENRAYGPTQSIEVRTNEADQPM